MNFKQYLNAQTEDELRSNIRELSTAKEIKSARLLFEIIENRLKELDDNNRMKPIISDDIRKDVRFTLGMARFAQWVLEIPTQAQKYLNMNM